MARLEVWLFERLAGGLSEDDSGRLTFAYDPEWAAEALPPLSQSLPVRAEPYGDAEARPFFSGLLPEGTVREHIAQRFGISARNDFSMLGAIGRECAGAVSVVPPGGSVHDRPSQSEDVRWLDENELADAVSELPSRPLFDDPEEGVRLSLAGVQDKMPVVCREGRIGITTGRTPSTHILKAPIARFDDTVVNEACCLRLATRLGLNAASVEIGHAMEREFLLVERFDREVGQAGARRLHQEDFCQALGMPPERKYAAEGGPPLRSCADLLRRASAAPAEDLLQLVDAVALNLLIGNHDAHGKNLSLLYAPTTGTRLAPLYDLVSTAVYAGLSRKLAMKIGGEYRADYVERRHVERFATECGLGPAAARRRVLGVAQAMEEVAPAVVQELRDTAGDRPVLDRMLGLIEGRAQRLGSLLG